MILFHFYFLEELIQKSLNPDSEPHPSEEITHFKVKESLLNSDTLDKGGINDCLVPLSVPFSRDIEGREQELFLFGLMFPTEENKEWNHCF